MPSVGEEQQLRVGVGDKQRGDHVFVLGRHARQALAAAPLRAVVDQGRAFGPAGGGDGDHHLLFLDQVLVVHVARPIDNLGAARHGEQALSPRSARSR